MPDLDRFIEPQSAVYSKVLAELRAGQKESHWIWFVFPQLQGLGSSAMAHRYGISGRAEAEAYLQHPILGLRLRECTELVLAIEGRRIEDIFGYPDDLKFRSSMTLFAQVGSEHEPFTRALDKYFNGEPDPMTLRLLK